MNYVGTYKGYKIFISDKPEKKYYALVNGKRIYFGQYGYEHYFDKMGIYSEFNHYDKQRRKNYKKRHESNRHNKGHPGWFSDQILW